MKPILELQKPIRGFVKAPTPEQLKATKEERYLLGVFWNWLKQGSKSQKKI